MDSADNGRASAPGGPAVTVAQLQDDQRFEVRVGGETAGFTAYVDAGGQRIFYHTEVGEQFAGQGLAGRLVAQALEETRQAGMHVVPVCPYVARYVGEHHDFDDIVDTVTPEALATLDRVLGS